MRESWTDERMDDLSKRVDDGFRGVKADMRTEFASVRAEIGGVRGDMRTEFASLRSEIASLNRTLALGFAGIVASVLGGVVAAFVAHAL